MKQFLALALIFVLALATVAACIPRGPVVVADQTFILTSSDLSSTTLYTPSASGLFRISAYTESDKVGSASNNLEPAMTWTDDSRTETDGCHAGTLTAGSTRGSGDCLMYATSGNPITILTANADFDLGATYTIYVVIEKL